MNSNVWTNSLAFQASLLCLAVRFVRDGPGKEKPLYLLQMSVTKLVGWVEATPLCYLPRRLNSQIGLVGVDMYPSPQNIHINNNTHPFYYSILGGFYQYHIIISECLEILYISFFQNVKTCEYVYFSRFDNFLILLSSVNLLILHHPPKPHPLPSYIVSCTFFLFLRPNFTRLADPWILFISPRTMVLKGEEKYLSHFIC